MGLPAPVFIHPKTISLGHAGVMRDPGPSQPGDSRSTVLEEGNSDSVDRAPGALGSSREAPGSEDFLEAVVPQPGLIEERGALQCTSGFFGAAGTSGAGAEPAENRLACGARPGSPPRCSAGPRALWRRPARGSDPGGAGGWTCWEPQGRARPTEPSSTGIRRNRKLAGGKHFSKSLWYICL